MGSPRTNDNAEDCALLNLFDRYEREVVPTKAPRTQLDNRRTEATTG